MELRKIEHSQITLTLMLNGDFDATGSRDALPHIDEVIKTDTHKDVRIDFKDVRFLDSSGIGAIVYLYKRLTEREREMRIDNVHGQPLEIMRLLRINNAIPVNSQNA